jgi:hypothetical protein
MDPTSQVFSHQIEVVELLSSYFDEIIVITGTQAPDLEIKNVRIVNLGWKPGRSLRNFNQLLKVFPIVKSISGEYRVFFHMTDVFAAFFSPYFRLKRKRQILWYAHAHQSKYLKWANKWVDSIVTSTPGSCPETGNKVIYLGQGVDHKFFAQIAFEQLKLDGLIHYGRFDRSKNIDQIISSVEFMRYQNSQISLRIIGTPLNNESQLWAREIESSWGYAIRVGWLTFSPAVNRRDIPQIIKENGVFIHAFQGSLDKTLIESTLLGVPVITLNKEYIKIFGSWSPNNSEISLVEEYQFMRALKNKDLISELNRRRQLAVQEHSIVQWVDKLVGELEVNA